MTTSPAILAIGVVDAHGVHGTSGLRSSWNELGGESPGDRRTFTKLFGRRDPTFRRLDGQTRAIVLAAEACGISQVLSVEERDETALITETSRGSIEIDLRYTRSLERDVVEAAIFPYTLQSTCLGDIALRHGLRGPTVCLSTETTDEGEALREAQRFFAAGALRHAVVALTDVQTESLPSADRTARSVVCVLSSDPKATSIVPWPQASKRPFEGLAEACYARSANQ